MAIPDSELLLPSVVDEPESLPLPELELPPELEVSPEPEPVELLGSLVVVVDVVDDVVPSLPVDDGGDIWGPVVVVSLEPRVVLPLLPVDDAGGIASGPMQLAQRPSSTCADRRIST